MSIQNIKQQDIYAIILAAGESSRLGSPKQLLPFKTKTLISHITETVATVFDDRFRIVLGAHRNLIEHEIADYKAFIIVNDHWQSGLASSIHTGIQSVQDVAQAVMIILADQALITQTHLTMLLTHWQKNPGSRIASTYDSISGVPAIFPKCDFSELLDLSGDKGARQLLNQEHNIIQVSIPEAAVDIDTQNDYKKLISHRAENH